MPRYTLRSLLTLFLLLLAVSLTFGLSTVLDHVASEHLKIRIGRQLVNRTLELGDKIDRALADSYQEMLLHADTLAHRDMTSRQDYMRTRLDKVQAANEGFAWIGYVGMDGKVIAATGGVLEGADVSARPWFSGARENAFVGDLHRALLLESKLNAGGKEPLRLIDIAVPVADEQGRMTGVLGSHIDWRWVKDISRSLPRSSPSDVLLVSADGTVLLGPPDVQDKRLSIDSVRRARAGQAGYLVERWPDGKSYLTGYSLSRGHREYPGLGWSVIERQELGVAFAPVHELSSQIIFWGLGVAGLFAVLGWFAAARIAHPLNAITRAAEALQHGGKAEIPMPRSYWEATMLARALRSLLSDVTRRESDLEHQATHNALTQLPNRALMKAVLAQAIVTGARENRLIAVGALNLDRFKSVNDTRGYTAGDAVLRETARRLADCVDGAGTLGHLGEDKFILVLEESGAGLVQGSRIFRRVQEAMALPFEAGGRTFHLTASVGVSLFPTNGQDTEKLLSFAELALYQAKQQGGNCVAFYEAKMNAEVQGRLALERDLRQALEAGQFELHYQPQVDLASGAVAGVEALLRWRHPQRGAVSPAEFIPVAESSGLILPLGDWVLRTACTQCAAWIRDGMAPLRMGVNVSVHQFKAGDLVDRVADALRTSGLPPDLLKLEITESVLMQEVERSIATMRALRELGVHLAIDDFGTGYSSLAYLQRFPISELKIDQTFIRELGMGEDGGAGATAIVQAVIALGHNLRMSVIAEGVETAEQAAFLRQAGCDEMQGFLFSRPLPALHVVALLRPAGPA
jgi:diguanylate cyclase (GGDEF)-like protein